MTSPIQLKILEDMKNALRAHEKERLTTIRLILAALKQREIDDGHIVLTDEQVLSILDKMLKQRRESISQYLAGNRPDLVKKEEDEINIIQNYLPQPLSALEIDAYIEAAIKETGALTIKDMGKIMAILKPQVQGRADLGAISAEIKKRLSV